MRVFLELNLSSYDRPSCKLKQLEFISVLSQKREQHFREKNSPEIVICGTTTDLPASFTDKA